MSRVIESYAACGVGAPEPPQCVDALPPSLCLNKAWRFALACSGPQVAQLAACCTCFSSHQSVSLNGVLPGRTLPWVGVINCNHVCVLYFKD